MKMFKKTAVTFAVLLMAGALFAQQSGTNIATAGTVSTDADKFMDVNDWSDSEFSSAFAFANVGLRDSISMGFASKTLLPVYFATFYSGNLWETDPDNSFSIFVGSGDLGVRAGIDIQRDNIAGIEYVKKSPYVQVGYNALGGKLAVNGGFGWGFSSVTQGNTTISYSAPVFDAGAMYEALNKGALSLSAGFNFSYGAENHKVTVNNTSTETNSQIIFVGPVLELSYDLSDSFKYGMKVSVPFVFADNGSGDNVNHNHKINFIVDNGFSADIVRNSLALNAGVETVLPSINIDDDDDPNGNLSNVYYVGLAFKLSDNVLIDSSANIFAGGDTVSMDDIWKTGLRFTASLKF